jgi:hypothetical protein
MLRGINFFFPNEGKLIGCWGPMLGNVGKTLGMLIVFVLGGCHLMLSKKFKLQGNDGKCWKTNGGVERHLENVN